MAYNRKSVIDLLQHLGYEREADEAARELPEQITLDDLIAFGDKHNISRDELTSRMGGSP